MRNDHHARRLRTPLRHCQQRPHPLLLESWLIEDFAAETTIGRDCFRTLGKPNGGDLLWWPIHQITRQIDGLSHDTTARDGCIQLGRSSAVRSDRRSDKRKPVAIRSKEVLPERANLHGSRSSGSELRNRDRTDIRIRDADRDVRLLLVRNRACRRDEGLVEPTGRKFVCLSQPNEQHARGRNPRDTSQRHDRRQLPRQIARLFHARDHSPQSFIQLSQLPGDLDGFPHGND